MALGVPFPQLQRDLPSWAFAWYLAYEQERPYGELGQDLRHGRLVSWYATERFKPPTTEGWRPEVIYPPPPDPTVAPWDRKRAGAPKRRQSVAGMEAVFQALVRAQAGRAG